MHNKSTLQILCIVTPSVILHALAMDIFVPCVPSMAERLNTSFANIQWVLSIFVLATGAGQMFVGPLADKFGRRVVMISSVGIFLLASIVCAIAPNVEILIIARLFQGLASCGTSIATLAIVRDIFEHEVRAKMYSYINGGIALAPLLAPLIGGYLLLWFNSWRATFYFLAGFSMLALVINCKWLRETKPNVNLANNFHSLYRIYKKILCTPQFLVFAICSTTGLTALFLFFSISSVLLIGKLGVAVEDFGYYFGLNALIFIISSAICSHVHRILPSLWHVVLWGSIIIGIGASCMIGWHLIAGLSKLGLMLPNLLITFGVGMVFGASVAMALKPFPDVAGMASAAYGTIEYSFAALLGALAMQFANDTTLPLGVTMLALSLLNIAALIFLRIRTAYYDA